MLYVIIAVIFVLISAYLFMIMPSLKKHSDSKILGERYIAHRGLHDFFTDTPENSLPAFKNAVDAGYSIEIDIHLTADGEVVVFHDSNTERMCGEKHIIEKMTLGEIKALRLKGGNCTIPTFTECLETVAGKVPLLIEFKCDNKNCNALCVAADKILSGYTGKYLIQSFYSPVLGWYRKNRGDICRGQLSELNVGKGIVGFMAGRLLFNHIGRPHFISYKFEDRNHFSFKLCRTFGAYTAGWTFRSQKDIDISKQSFKAFIFENFIPDKKM